ncbi:hypothetical protein KKG46_04295 [Patescibacteria group bacterium]|nr:hypothetical protein [Patescibacteria group bacterium]
MIDTQINAVRREIDNLIKIGMIIETEEGGDDETKRPGLKRKYYRVNMQFPLINEIQSLMSKSHFLMEQRLDSEILESGDVRYLAFMGSFIGKEGPVDLFIVGEIEKQKLAQIVQRAEQHLGFVVNFTCMPEQEYIYRKDIADRFLLSVFNAPKHVAVDKLSTEKASK